MNVVEEFYRKEYDSLVRRVKNRAGSIENAEDVVQEAFCKALQYYDTCINKDNFGAWFRPILDNTLKDNQREERLGGMSLSIEEVEDEDIHDEIVDHYLPSVKRLKPLHKKIVHMYFQLGNTKKEIAEILGVSFETVNTTIRRFSEKLRVGND